MIDAAELKQRVDLLDLIGRDTTLKKVASTRGGEYAGPCPKCGGTDRFHVQAGGYWMCRGCHSDWSDAIEYLRWRDGVSFSEACEQLDGGMLPAAAAPRPAPPSALIIEAEPTEAWRATAELIVSETVACLWSDTGERARTWLHERGLSDETIRRRELGLNPVGLGERRIHGFTVAGGVTIPWRVASQLWHVNVRRPIRKPEDGPKYKSIAGGHPFLYGADDLEGNERAILVEGEFDAMLLDQLAGDVIGVATLGGALKGLTPRAISYLLPFTHIFAAYDRDGAGQEGADRLAAVSKRIRLVHVPSGKDVTEFLQLGGRPRDWVYFELAKLDYELKGRSVQPASPPIDYHDMPAAELLGAAIDAGIVMAGERGFSFDPAGLPQELAAALWDRDDWLALALADGATEENDGTGL